VLQKAETDWTEEILMHNDITGQLSEELEKIPPQKIYMGYYTDPYQPCESGYRQTRKVLKLFLEKGFSASILTKSDLVVRDIDLLKEMNAASVSVSVAFNDNDTRRHFEANTIDTEDRIEGLHKLREAGIKTSALICPVIPYITDVTPLIDSLVSLTDLIWIYGLSIEKRSDRNWENVKGILKSQFSEFQQEIEKVIFSKDHPYWTRLRKKLSDFKESRGLNLSIHL
jgi:DNA repair photolyase